MTTTTLPVFPGDLGAYSDQAPVPAAARVVRVRKPNRRPGSIVTAAVTVLVSFLLAAAFTAVLTAPARASADSWVGSQAAAVMAAGRSLGPSVARERDHGGKVVQVDGGQKFTVRP